MPGDHLCKFTKFISGQKALGAGGWVVHPSVRSPGSPETAGGKPSRVPWSPEGRLARPKLSETLSRGPYLHSCAGSQSRPRCLHRPVRRDAWGPLLYLGRHANVVPCVSCAGMKGHRGGAGLPGPGQPRSRALAAVPHLPGPLCSVCVNRFGCRPVMLAGGLLASLGMVSASFCGSIIQLYLTTGVLTGE